MEEWKPIFGYGGLYYVSNLGKISNSNTNRILSQGFSEKGYRIIGFTVIGKKYKSFKVHRLVATHFIPNPENKPQINHKNGIKSDNRVDNLEWVTGKENIQHAIDTGLHSMKGKFGKDNRFSKKVNQYTKTGEFIREWDSMMDVRRELGINHSDISRCCLLKSKSAGGFIWKFNNTNI